MITEHQLRDAESLLASATIVGLVCHRKPDGDALGSTLGLGLALAGRGATVHYWCTDPVPQHYQYLPGAASFARPPADLAGVELAVMLDCGADHMTGLNVGALIKRVPLLDIDHHPKQTLPTDGRVTVYDSCASSTAEIVTELLTRLEWVIDRDIATCLLTGIVTDTSAFQNTNTSDTTLRTAAALLNKGARLKEIIRHCFYTSSIPKLRLWGIAMARIEQNAKIAGIVSTVITKEDIVECGAHPDDVEGLVNFLNTIPGVPALMLLTDMEEGFIKGSLRTRHRHIDVNRLAQAMGGGGHQQAAGFLVPGRLVRRPDDSWEVRTPPGTGQTNTRSVPR